jgi:hypothetical protein
MKTLHGALYVTMNNADRHLNLNALYIFLISGLRILMGVYGRDN